MVHDIRDDYESAATIFELILSVPVKITGRLQGQLRSTHPVFSSLNDTQLGINFTTGNAAYDGGEDEIVVTVGPINNEQLKQFMPGTKKNKILEMLCDYLLPVHVDVNTDFELYDTEQDISESNNLMDVEREKAKLLVKELGKLLRKHTASMPMLATTGTSVLYPDEVMK